MLQEPADVMDDKSPIVPLEQDGVKEMKEKNKLVGLGIVLVVVAVFMFVGSSVALHLMMKAKSVTELFKSMDFGLTYVESTLIDFRIMTANMILLAILQLISNALFTAAVMKGKFDLIFRYNGLHSLVMIMAASCFWVLTLVILSSRIRKRNGGYAPAVFLFVGIAHICIIIKIFATVHAQKHPPAEKAAKSPREPWGGFNA